MLTAIAGGKIAADGSILKATPGITISTELIHTNVDIGYTVNLPERLVSDANYIVQLTAENFGENGPDYEVTTIAARFPSVNGFEVIIWANSDRDGALPRTRIVPVKSNWHFVVYDIN